MMPEEGLSPENPVEGSEDQPAAEIPSVEDANDETNVDSVAETVNEEKPELSETQETNLEPKTPEVEEADSLVEPVEVNGPNTGAETEASDSDEAAAEIKEPDPEPEKVEAEAVNPDGKPESGEPIEETTEEEKLTAEVVDSDAEVSEEADSGAEGEEKVEGVVEESEGSEESEANDLMAEILGDETNLDAVVEKASPNELILLIENIAERGDVGEFISKVGNIKRTFDKKTGEEETETALLTRFSTALARFNKKRIAYYSEREKEKEENSRKKFAILERLKAIVQEEQVTKIQNVRAIQTEWREVGWVLQKDIQPLNETYRQYLDIYYNLRAKYQELLSLDREYNLKQKKALIVQIENLIPGEDGNREVWRNHSQKVRTLQEEWKSAGHVPKENIDELNTSYRDVLDRFYEMRSGYYEVQDQQKSGNAILKKELLEQLKVYADFQSDKAKDWNEGTKTVLSVQEKWKKIGPGPIDENKQLWKDYRKLCDTFFNGKGKFFKSFDEKRTSNLALKVGICEIAESLKESEEWKETAKVLKDLQTEWKTIGPVHERHSNKVWKRFRRACDHFFNRRTGAQVSGNSEFNDNLKIKEGLIKEVQALAQAEDAGSRIEEFNALQVKWKATGHVPFKVKDKINKTFKEALGLFFKNSKMSRGDMRHFKVGTSIDSMSNLDARERRIESEIRKVRGRVRPIEEKVSQYELNIQYISKGKSGDSLRNQIQGQIDIEKEKMKSLKAKVKELRYMLDNPPQPEEEKKKEEEE